MMEVLLSGGRDSIVSHVASLKQRERLHVVGLLLTMWQRRQRNAGNAGAHASCTTCGTVGFRHRATSPLVFEAVPLVVQLQQSLLVGNEVHFLCLDTLQRSDTQTNLVFLFSQCGQWVVERELGSGVCWPRP